MSDRQYAGFWIRVAANLIDLAALLLVIALPLTLIYGKEYWQGGQLIYGVWHVLLAFVLPVVATIWFWLTYRATPGKLVMGLAIVDEVSGEKMRLGQAIGRYAAFIMAALPMGIGLLWVVFDNKNQGWHDKLAGTVVIRGA